MTASLSLTEAAEADLVEIWQFIAEDSVSKADSLLASLDDKAATLARNPEIGRLRPELADELRSFPIGNYILFYTCTPEGILIARVLHGAQDIERMFA
jgi:toxin ParE1/3/4